MADAHTPSPLFQHPKDHLCVALDLDDVDTASRLVERVQNHVGVFKIGYQLGFAGGLVLAEKLSERGIRVFLDFKLHDIGNTVSSGVLSLARSGATFITVHAYPPVMRAAREALSSLPEDKRAALLGVTVLTSLDDDDLKQAGFHDNVETLVQKRALMARQEGLDGLVCSAQEASRIRHLVGPGMILVTPGIRPDEASKDDQKRIVTPAKAIADGADLLVVGRPVLKAEDPVTACQTIVSQIEKGLALRPHAKDKG
jgi:orotidine-5'-phosphate decarboxylase